MSVRIQIQGQIINIPSSGESPNWAPAMIEAFQAIEQAINSFVGTYDIAPQIQNIDAYNEQTNVDITNLVFPVSEVRSATIYYTVYRTNTTPIIEASEAGTIEIDYKDTRAVGSKWQVVRTSQGDSSIEFNVTDTGQVQFSTTSIGTGTHTGIISFRAITILNS